MNPQCARCGRVVYPTEKVTCLDKFWHKGCFHCEVCKMTLNMNNYKGYDKKPYCNAHYPKQSFTTVADTPENLRLKQQSALQSQVKYKKDFEDSKGRGFSIVTDTPELQRLKKTQEQISNIKDMRVPTIVDSREDDSDDEGKVFPKPVVEGRNMEFARKCSELISDSCYKEKYEKSKGKCLFVPDTVFLKNVSDSISKVKYREDMKKLPNSLFKQMPATIDTAFAKEVSQFQSEVLYKLKHDSEKGKSSYACMQEPPDVKHAMEVSKQMSDVSYRRDAQDMHKYNDVLNRADIKFATESAKNISNVEYKKDRGDMKKESAVLGRPDFEHAMEASKIVSQVLYKLKHDSEKGKSSYACMQEPPDVKHAMEVSKHMSDVSYRRDAQDMHKYNDVLNRADIKFATESAKNISNVEYKKDRGDLNKESAVLGRPDFEHAMEASKLVSQVKYKEDMKKLPNSLYKQMPATIDTAFAKEVSQFQSKVLYKLKHDSEKGKSSYACMQEPPDVKHAMEVSKQMSDVSYRKDAQDMHKYNDVLNRADIKFATESAKNISNVEYKKGRGDLNKESAVLGRPDFEHAMEASKLVSQVKYKEKFDQEMKTRRLPYNPLESASFRQAQMASVLASDVIYKKDKHQLHDPTLDLPNMLYLEHALKASHMQSRNEYRKDFEANKGIFHFSLDTAEQIHHKENAVLQSQLKYKEDYEKSKGRSMLEFVDTPAYQVSKDTQKFQSQKLYRKEYEEGIKGRAAADLELTPMFLHVKHVTNMLKEKEYRKDLEEGVKGKGLTVLEDTPDLIRVKNASQILNEKEYRKDLENEIKGKGMNVSGDIPDIQRAKRVSEMVSEKEYKKDLETEIKGKGMTVGMDVPDMQRAKRASEIASQNKYKDKAEKMLSTFSTVADTPEIQRVKVTQRNISNVLYKEGVRAGTAVEGTPETERIKKTQQNISAIKYKEDIGTPTAISDPPEMKRVKENQKNISNILYKEQLGKGTSVSVTPEMERVKKNQAHLSLVQYKGQPGKATAVSVTPEIERVKKNQEHFSKIHYKEQLGKVTSVSVTPEMERVKKNQENISSVKYSSDLKQMKGRPSVIIDTPELRHVRETQNNISMVKYHEDFEKTKGRGFTPVLDDPVTERVRRNTQIVSDAAYKGVHPHVVEMDRKPGIIVDLKVWRTDPGSIFDIDPLEDNIQSRSLRILTERASRFNKQQRISTRAAELSLGDDRSDVSELNHSLSFCSEGTRPSYEGAPVLPGAYQQSQPQGYGYMHQTSMSSMRSMHSQPHSPGLKTYRAMYDYSAHDEDEVSFRDGDYITNVQAIDDGWMYGTVQRTGKSGMLPANYIELVN